MIESQQRRIVSLCIQCIAAQSSKLKDIFLSLSQLSMSSFTLQTVSQNMTQQ